MNDRAALVHCHDRRSPSRKPPAPAMTRNIGGSFRAINNKRAAGARDFASVERFWACGSNEVKPMEPLVYLTRSEFARKLGVSKTRVTQMVRARLPVLRSGGLELGLALRWVSHTAVRGRSRWRDRGCHRADALLRELAEGPGADAA